MNKYLLILSALIFVINGCTAQTNASKTPVQLNLMTFNIRYDNPADSMNNWKYRKDYAASMILKNDVDVMGTQEVLNNQLNDLLILLPGYAFQGVGRKTGKLQENTVPYFIKKSGLN